MLDELASWDGLADMSPLGEMDRGDVPSLLDEVMLATDSGGVYMISPLLELA
jgi:hypothetical protein